MALFSGPPERVAALLGSALGPQPAASSSSVRREHAGTVWRTVALRGTFRAWRGRLVIGPGRVQAIRNPPALFRFLGLFPITGIDDTFTLCPRLSLQVPLQTCPNDDVAEFLAPQDLHCPHQAI